MYARTTTFMGDVARLDDGIAFVQDTVMPKLTDTEGCTGLSLIVDRASGRSIVTSAWRDEDALFASDSMVSDLRQRGGEILGGAPKVEVWEIAALHRAHESGPGACVRVSWTQIDPMHADRSIDNFRSVIVPELEELPGFCSVSLLADRKTGLAASSVTYASREMMARNREAAAAIRRGAVEENDMRVLEVAEFDLVLAHLRVPELV
jgi:quinol monooxygenase YgiN